MANMGQETHTSTHKQTNRSFSNDGAEVCSRESPVLFATTSSRELLRDVVTTASCEADSCESP